MMPTALRDAYATICQNVIKTGHVTKPRGYETREVLGVTMVFQDLHQAIPVGTGRNLNPAIGAAEALLLCGGISDPTLLCNVSSQFKKFLDGGILHGSYGPRVRPQLPKAVERLSKDPDSRQAFISIWDGLYDADNTRDLPCTVSFNFHIRDERLIMHSHMRSQDVFLGLPYDVFFFGQLGMTVAKALDLDPVETQLVHTVDSLHAYARNFDAIEELEPYSEGLVTDAEKDAVHGPLGFGDRGNTIETAMIKARDIHAGDLECDMNESEQWYVRQLMPYDRLSATSNFTV